MGRPWPRVRPTPMVRRLFRDHRGGGRPSIGTPPGGPKKKFPGMHQVVEHLFAKFLLGFSEGPTPYTYGFFRAEDDGRSLAELAPVSSPLRSSPFETVLPTGPLSGARIPRKGQSRSLSSGQDEQFCQPRANRSPRRWRCISEPGVAHRTPGTKLAPGLSMAVDGYNSRNGKTLRRGEFTIWLWYSIRAAMLRHPHHTSPAVDMLDTPAGSMRLLHAFHIADSRKRSLRTEMPHAPRHGFAFRRR
jgi:hypothetical protein